MCRNKVARHEAAFAATGPSAEPQPVNGTGGVAMSTRKKRDGMQIYYRI
jgi:hypothetical protein